jgi:hypothetical protein
MAIYEELQDAHRLEETVRVLVGPGVPACVVSDMIDLPRLHCTVLEGEQTVRPLLRRYGLEDRVWYWDGRKRAEARKSWHFLITAGDPAELKTAVPYERSLYLDGEGKLQRKAGPKSRGLLRA